METVNNVINKEQFQKEQDQLLQTILDLRYFLPWQGIMASNDNTSIKADSNLELYITNKCNQKCDYCYLTKYPDLYPSECNTPECITKNLDLLCQYMLLNHFSLNQLDLFSGEIWHTSLGLKIFEILLNYVKLGLKINQIVIPSNCYFVNDDQQMHYVQSFIDQFMQQGVVVSFSISVDGKIIDNMNRPRNNNVLYTDEFYDRLFTFAKANEYYFHPMISSKTAKYWIENYKWWKKQFKYYELDIQTMMILEVRNNDWTDEDLKEYCKVLKFLLNDFFIENCNSNVEYLARILGSVRYGEDLPRLNYGYYPWSIPLNNDVFGCSVNKFLTIRLGDLAICPCHRTAYDKYIYGYFNVEDDMITGIRAQNPYMAIKVLMGSTYTAYPICNECAYNRTCMKGCLGAQIEEQADPFFPIPGICKFFKTKIKFLIHCYRELGVIDYLKTVNLTEYYTDVTEYLLLLDKIVDKETDEEDDE